VRSVSEVADQELLWIQPAARRREHELRAGDDVVATLRFQRGSLADVASSDRTGAVGEGSISQTAATCA
jgi:hypothetical protein